VPTKSDYDFAPKTGIRGHPSAADRSAPRIVEFDQSRKNVVKLDLRLQPPAIPKNGRDGSNEK
jgi:hypothetical protein